MPGASELHPVNPATIPDAEKETEAPWIVRKLAGVSFAIYIYRAPLQYHG
jgi:hypothetical protein